MKYADEFFEVNKKYPVINSRKLSYHPFEWTYINTCLHRGFRKLKGGSSLRKLLVANNRVEEYLKSKDSITLKEIFGAIEKYHKLNGVFPTYKSGNVGFDFSENIRQLTTWSSIHTILNQGRYGLKKTSLQKIIANKYYFRTGARIDWKETKISENELLEACKLFYKKYNFYNENKTGKIKEKLTANIIENDNWGSFDAALRDGNIKTESNAPSLSKLLEDHQLRKRIINHSKIKITLEDLEKEIENFKKKTIDIQRPMKILKRVLESCGLQL